MRCAIRHFTIVAFPVYLPTNLISGQSENKNWESSGLEHIDLWDEYWLFIKILIRCEEFVQVIEEF